MYRESIEGLDAATIITDAYIGASSQIKTLDDMHRLFKRAICVEDINRCAKRMSMETYLVLRVTLDLKNATSQLSITNAISNMNKTMHRTMHRTRLEDTIDRLNGKQHDIYKSTEIVYWEKMTQHSKLLLDQLTGIYNDPLLGLEISALREFYKKLIRIRNCR